MCHASRAASCPALQVRQQTGVELQSRGLGGSTDMEGRGMRTDGLCWAWPG